MLKEEIFTSACTKEVFFGYISSNCLIKKLEYFRDCVIMNREVSEDSSSFMISIKKFNEIK